MTAKRHNLNKYLIQIKNTQFHFQITLVTLDEFTASSRAIKQRCQTIAGILKLECFYDSGNSGAVTNNAVKSGKTLWCTFYYITAFLWTHIQSDLFRRVFILYYFGFLKVFDLIFFLSGSRLPSTNTTVQRESFSDFFEQIMTSPLSW